MRLVIAWVHSLVGLHTQLQGFFVVVGVAGAFRRGTAVIDDELTGMGFLVAGDVLHGVSQAAVLNRKTRIQPSRVRSAVLNASDRSTEVAK